MTATEFPLEEVIEGLKASRPNEMEHPPILYQAFLCQYNACIVHIAQALQQVNPAFDVIFFFEECGYDGYR